MGEASINETNLYRELIESVNIGKISLLGLDMFRTEDLRVPLRVKHDLSIPDDEISVEELAAKVLFTLEASAKEAEDPQISVKMAWLVKFELNEGVTVDEFGDDLIRQFLTRNIPINVWPYIRETVSSLTGKMGLPPLLIPTLKIIR